MNELSFYKLEMVLVDSEKGKQLESFKTFPYMILRSFTEMKQEK